MSKIYLTAILLLSGCELFTSNPSQSKEEQAEKAILSDNSDAVSKLLQSGLYPSSKLLDFAIKHKAQKSGILLTEKVIYISSEQFERTYTHRLDDLLLSMIEKSTYLAVGFDEKIIKDDRTNLLKRFVKHRIFGRYDCGTYLRTALKHRRAESLQILLKENTCIAKLHLGDSLNSTMLHVFVEKEDASSVELLLNNGAASIINHQDTNKDTAFDLRIRALDSKRPKSDEILTLLCNHEAFGENESFKYSCSIGWKNDAPSASKSGLSLEECIRFYKQEDSNFNSNWDLQHSSEERDTLSKKTFRVLTKKFHKDLGSSETNRAEKMQKTTECNNVFFEKL